MHTIYGEIFLENKKCIFCPVLRKGLDLDFKEKLSWRSVKNNKWWGHIKGDLKIYNLWWAYANKVCVKKWNYCCWTDYLIGCMANSEKFLALKLLLEWIYIVAKPNGCIIRNKRNEFRFKKGHLLHNSKLDDCCLLHISQRVCV